MGIDFSVPRKTDDEMARSALVRTMLDATHCTEVSAEALADAVIARAKKRAVAEGADLTAPHALFTVCLGELIILMQEKRAKAQ